MKSVGLLRRRTIDIVGLLQRRTIATPYDAIFVGLLTRLRYTTLPLSLSLCDHVPTGSPSRGGNVAVYIFDINQPSLPTPFYSVLVSISVFTAFSTVFHTIKSPDNSPPSHSALLVLFLPYWSFQKDICL